VPYVWDAGWEDHGFHGCTVADVPVDGRRVSVKVRRLVCAVLGGPAADVPRAGPWTTGAIPAPHNRVGRQLVAVIAELADGRAACLSRVLAASISRSTALRLQTRLQLPALRVPRVVGGDDFALKRHHR
jgi:hypothetical protein